VFDGVLLRLAHDRFWMAQADGELFSWYRAHAVGLDVRIHDPDVWISQIQGPRSLDFLEVVLDGKYPEPFKYFDCATVTIAEQIVVISRSGFTNELGWEIYMSPEIDFEKLGAHLLKVGETFDMPLTAIPVFRARRIEAGLLSAGCDFDQTTTPYAAGLSAFVDLDKPDFVGREPSSIGCCSLIKITTRTQQSRFDTSRPKNRYRCQWHIKCFSYLEQMRTEFLEINFRGHVNLPAKFIGETRPTDHHYLFGNSDCGAIKVLKGFGILPIKHNLQEIQRTWTLDLTDPNVGIMNTNIKPHRMRPVPGK
jgi:hypothetical protein